MTTEEFIVANLKCNGCASTIKKELLQIAGVNNVEVDLEKDLITVMHDDADHQIIISRLLSLGYPEATETNGLLRQLKNYKSCMIGRITNP